MFMLMPKRRPRLVPADEITADHAKAEPVRTRNACDSCRLHKAKVHGRSEFCNL